MNIVRRSCGLFFVVLFFVFLTFLVFKDFVIFAKVPFSILIDVFPVKYAAFSTLMSGQYPKWNPYIFLGLPFVGDNLSNPLNIFNLSFLFFQPMRAYIVSLMIVFFLGQLAFYLLAHQELKLRMLPAAISSMLFMFFVIGFLREFHYHVLMSCLAPVALTPLAFLLFIRAVNRGSYPYSIWCGVFCAFLLFIGLISWTANTFFLFGVYAIYKGLSSWKMGESLSRAMRPASYFLVAFIVFTFVAAIEIIPMVHLVANSQRRITFGGYSNILPIKYLGGFFFPASIALPVGLGSIINLPPAMYVGSAGIVLAALGAIKFRCKESLFYLSLIAAPSAALFVLFRLEAVNIFWQRVPFLASQQLTRLMMTLYPMSSAILVAFGLQFLWENLSSIGKAGIPPFSRHLLKLILAINLAAAVAFTLFFFSSLLLKPLFQSNLQTILEKFISPGSAAYPYPIAYYKAKALDIFGLMTSSAFFWAFMAAILIRTVSLIYLGAVMQKGGKFALYLTSALLVADLFLADKYNFFEETHYRDSKIIAFLKERMSPGDRAVMWHNEDYPDLKSVSYDYEKLKEQRIEFVEKYIKRAFYPNILMFFAIPEIGGAHSLYYWRYLNYIDNIEKKVERSHGERSSLRNVIRFVGDPPDEKLLNMLGMRYLFAQKQLSNPKLKLLMGSDQNERGLYLYENIGAMPRSYVVKGEAVFDKDIDVLRRLKSDDFDPRRQALIHLDGIGPDAQKSTVGAVPTTAKKLDRMAGGAPSTVVAKRTESEHAEAKIIDYQPNSVRIKASGFDEAYLVLSDNYFPGWKATVDGRPVKVLRANYLMRAVSLGPGQHQVEFYFDPPAFKAGAAITVAALFFILCHFCFLTSRRRRGAAIERSGN